MKIRKKRKGSFVNIETEQNCTQLSIQRAAAARAREREREKLLSFFFPRRICGQCYAADDDVSYYWHWQSISLYRIQLWKTVFIFIFIEWAGDFCASLNIWRKRRSWQKQCDFNIFCWILKIFWYDEVGSIRFPWAYWIFQFVKFIEAFIDFCFQRHVSLLDPLRLLGVEWFVAAIYNENWKIARS